MVREFTSEGENLGEAKAILGRIYQRWLNLLLAGNYDYGQVLTHQPNLLPEEEKALNLIRGRQFEEKMGSRVAERIDHFLRGVGLRVGKDGLWETVPERLRHKRI